VILSPIAWMLLDYSHFLSLPLSLLYLVSPTHH
jgi:hypothetical protein